MYAIIEDGAHRYKVSQGDTLDVHLHDLDEGRQTIEFGRVPMVGQGADSKIGLLFETNPFLKGHTLTRSQ